MLFINAVITVSMNTAIEKFSKEKIDLVNELHKPIRLKFKRRHTVVKGIDDLWQGDLAEMTNYSQINRSYKYILVVIDCFSKYLWTRPLKNKTMDEVSTAMADIINTDHRCPKHFQTDFGTEFYNKKFNNLMKQHNISHFSSFSTLKATIAERSIRSLKIRLYKLFSLYGNYKWIHLLNDVTSEYNHSRHRTIGMKPIDVNVENEKEILNSRFLNRCTISRKRKFKLNDIVRISRSRHVFEKGYTPNYTTELFKIVKVCNTFPPTYLLEDLMGSSIKGGFYEEELLKTQHSNIYLVEKVIRKRGTQLFVKWLGFDKKHNSWIEAAEVY